ncbi:Crp/Fnr family transcriptional regulator [Pedobacter metabolipauper]|uniref:CRP-like cAMP-binding protein n=1 Tax=Pedobacter metabolipauper TaxID=425513 RepID=A0A4V3D1H7_9SPHI|nr:Crp/Fnr family transcriptional regulator [Pedobacter metabolipauper]TDQ11223.1 CRP-like cAMP-binding protein [Pedobacter metabolipauper]
MFEILAAYLREKAGLNNEELKLVEAVTVVKKLRKRQYLLQEGDISHYNCFIAKGCLRLFRVSTDGAEHILKFGVENWWMSDYESYNSGLPAKGNIDALEDSELLLIKKENFDALCKEIPNFQSFITRLEAKSFDVSQNRILSNISESAEEKYENFIKSYPAFFRRVPLHMIASYLGVSRETLTRVRQKYVR